MHRSWHLDAGEKDGLGWLLYGRAASKAGLSPRWLVFRAHTVWDSCVSFLWGGAQALLPHGSRVHHCLWHSGWFPRASPLQDAGSSAESRRLLSEPDAADEDLVPCVLCQPPVCSERPHGAQVRLRDLLPRAGSGAMGSPRSSSFLSDITCSAVRTFTRLFKDDHFNYPRN